MDQLLVLVNPAGGDGQSIIDVAANVLPLLQTANIFYQLKTTDAPGHAGTLAREFIESGVGTHILVAGGDGTIHEVINGLLLGDNPLSSAPDVTFVLWPGGTANALYASLYPSSVISAYHSAYLSSETDDQTAYKLKSVLSYIASRDTPSSSSIRPLTLASTEILDASGTPTSIIVSTVVTSTALHAAILHTADQIRDTFPGIGRFGEAAKRNAAKWTDSNVTLFGSDGRTAEGIQTYDPSSDTLIPLPISDSASLELRGPFSYFLSTVNVDRLEPTFIITPLITTHKPSRDNQSMEIVIIRPERDPTVAPENGERESASSYSDTTKAKFAQETVMKTLTTAYQKGGHVSLRYTTPDGISQGEPIVEYFRATGWEWCPTSEDEASHLVCADGTILRIPAGGKARCQLVGGTLSLSSTSVPVPKFGIWTESIRHASTT